MNLHDQSAEWAVIGSCFVEVEAILASRQFVAPAHFYTPRLGAIYGAILEMNDAGKSVDVVTLPDHLRRAGTWDEASGAALLADCISSVGSAAHAGHYAKIVARYYFDREIFTAAGKLAVAIGENMGEEPQPILSKISSLVLARTELDSPETFDYSTSLGDALDAILSGDKKEPTYPFHLPPLDAICDGMKKGEVQTLGAATNQGKSVLLLNLMDRQAQHGVKCLFVGSEMTARETFARHLSNRSGVDAWKFRTGKLSDDDRARAHAAVADHLHNLPIQILDDPEPSLERIEAAIARTKPDAVFLDYLERMTLPPAKDLRLSVKEFMRRLKGIARKRGVMVLLASQLNRTTYARDNDTPPTLADLSESSAIEKESDRVFLLWRPKILQPDPAAANYKAVLEIVKAKDRHGPNGLKTYLELDGKTLKIQEPQNDFAEAA